MMNQYVKQKWITALRSGEYKQTGGRLRKGDCYCCLGVLTDLYDKDKDIKCHEWHEEDGQYVYVSGDEGDEIVDEIAEATLPESVMKWAELDETNPTVREDRMGEPLTSLAYLNDNEGLDFNQLADIIEKQL
jgi:hypothetical protein